MLLNLVAKILDKGVQRHSTTVAALLRLLAFLSLAHIDRLVLLLLASNDGNVIVKRVLQDLLIQSLKTKTNVKHN